MPAIARVRSSSRPLSQLPLLTHHLDNIVLESWHIHFHLHSRRVKMGGRCEVALPFRGVGPIRAAVGHHELSYAARLLPHHGVTIVWAMRDVDIQIHGF